jgi:FkbM family methyltransferase
MSLKKQFLKTKWSYRLYLIYNLYVRHKCFQKRKKYSQWGEDQEITNFFNDKKKGIYLDIGCYHPIMYSNTCLLFNMGWHGINIDMNPTSIDLFNIVRPNDINICTALSNESKKVKAYYDDLFSPINTIDKNFYEKSKHVFKNHEIKEINSKKISDILAEKNINKEIDFLNIDIEGLDFEILKQINIEDYKIKLIAIETHNVNGEKSEDCDDIKMWLKNRKYIILKSIGPSTLFAKN